jgi:hypothetical protein
MRLSERKRRTTEYIDLQEYASYVPAAIQQTRRIGWYAVDQLHAMEILVVIA